jgi:hypothetical protein
MRDHRAFNGAICVLVRLSAAADATVLLYDTWEGTHGRLSEGIVKLGSLSEQACERRGL